MTSEPSRPRSNRMIWRARLFVLAGIVIVVGSGVFLTRWIRLAGIADTPEPFDLVSFGKARIPAESNAYLEYEKASKLLIEDKNRVLSAPRALHWDELNDDDKAWIARNRPALKVWLKATERSDSQAYLPQDLELNQSLLLSSELRMLARLAETEASRLETEGKPGDAWPLYRGRLRMGLHLSKRGLRVERFLGNYYFNEAVAEAKHWAENPKLNESNLKQALADAEALAPLLPKNSDTLKIEYVYMVLSLRETAKLEQMVRQLMPQGSPNPNAVGAGQSTWPSYLSGVQAYLIGEPERSRRAARLAFGNWLEQADRPVRERTPTLSTEPLVFQAPNAPDVLRASLEQSYYTTLSYGFTRSGGILASLNHWPSTFTAERRNYADLVIFLASKLHERRTGVFPENPSTLVGAELKAVPEGAELLDSTDPVDVPPEGNR